MGLCGEGVGGQVRGSCAVNGVGFGPPVRARGRLQIKSGATDPRAGGARSVASGLGADSRSGAGMTEFWGAGMAEMGRGWPEVVGRGKEPRERTLVG